MALYWNWWSWTLLIDSSSARKYHVWKRTKTRYSHNANVNDLYNIFVKSNRSEHDIALGGILAATKQLYEWFSPSVCLSVRPSHLLTMYPSSCHHKIFRSYYQWQKGRPCKRSRSEVKGQGHWGQHPTKPFPDCNSSLNSDMMMKWCTELDSA